MKKISDTEYYEYMQYKRDKENGKILTPLGLKFIIEANNYNAEAVGRHFINTLPKVMQER